MVKSLGVCVGASSISTVLVEQADGRTKVLDSKSISHDGNPRVILQRLLTPDLLAGIDRLAITGRKFRSLLHASSISEPEAVEYAYRFSRAETGDANLIVSAGGETFMVYQLDQTGQIINVYTGNKCASGTGEFFLQQLKRMDLEIEEAIQSADIENPYRLSGRCSVFCKSDCTHALNKGTDKGRVVAGLCEMMATKIIELLKRVENQNVLVIGGTSENMVMHKFLEQKVAQVRRPAQARSFEAFGAALWGLEHETAPITNVDHIFVQQPSSFSFLPPMSDYVQQVTFKENLRQTPRSGDVCIVGLDVGSTTTKAVLMRESDDAILASCYLRTNGDPIGASRQCYRELARQTPADLSVIALGVTGSGRQIAGLHALTPAIINEIIAHASAAVYFDPEVDTIFEIGGQDAKYTYITNKVPSDYAMNEACSAGTGSFLEESAREALDIDVTAIADIAMRSSRAPNFSDQCAAFINSDIKSAVQEGIPVEDIAAGLVYSICMNYANRVKGSRAVGRKVFMQGGVCYNRAVPVAMAALTGKDIIVPPEPGLMGAFGVALEVKHRLQLGLLKPARFDLQELADREVVYQTPFQCGGGKEKCDRKCMVNRIVIEGKIYPFGGACNKYYNLLQDKPPVEVGQLDLVQVRERMVFNDFSRDRAVHLLPANGKKIGVNRSLMTHNLFPLFYNFFTALGFEVILPDTCSQEGMERKGAAFCFPVEQAHGFLEQLLTIDCDYYFLPHIRSMPVENSIANRVTCPFVQGEPYYLRASFKALSGKQVLSPVLNFAQGYAPERTVFVRLGKQLGINGNLAGQAFDLAHQAQTDFHSACRELGSKVLADLAEHPEQIGIVLFGRPYNAFTRYGNMGISNKFASRGYVVIPCDFLPFEQEAPVEKMYWAMGQLIMKSAQFVQTHPQLFGTYITNFSCGPDSFIITYFRDLMGKKPSLTLELDSHTADAGLDTRIEAFLDVVKNYLEISAEPKPAADRTTFQPVSTGADQNGMWVADSRGNRLSIKDPRVHMLIPSMGSLGSQMLAATFRHIGIQASSLPTPTDKDFKAGQGLASCKECLPLILTLGGLLTYLEARQDPDEVTVYFMPEASGPCRFGQYNILMRKMVEKYELPNVGFLTLSDENTYSGFDRQFVLRAWQAIVTADVLEEVYSALLVLAQDRAAATQAFQTSCQRIVEAIATLPWAEVRKVLIDESRRLGSIPRREALAAVPKIALTGEIFVRRDDFSRQYLIERMASKGIVVKTAPISEWIYYCDYVTKNKITRQTSLRDVLKTTLQGWFQRSHEKDIKRIFAQSGLYHFHLVDVDQMINNASSLISPQLPGEAILTVGLAISEIIDQVSGVISIGPFGCMPSRIAEAIISQTLSGHKPLVADNPALVNRVLEKYPALPFLSIETDGNLFPQGIEARLEAFCIQVERLHKQILHLKQFTG